MARSVPTAAFLCRPAQPGDLDALMALEDSSFSGDRLSRRQMRYHLGNPGVKIWVCADSGDRPVAYVLGFFHAGRAPRLYSLAVSETCRGRGLGERLVRVFLDQAARQGHERAVLEVRSDSPGAIRLYEKVGFTRQRLLPSYYEDGCDGIKMVVNL